VKTRFSTEMEQKTDLELRGTQITEELQGCTRVEALAGFDLHDQPVIDEHVKGLPCEGLAAVVNHHRDLSRDSVALRDQLAFEGKRVNVFSIAIAECTVYSEERTDCCMRQLFLE
jgi:hypothetical protein